MNAILIYSDEQKLIAGGGSSELIVYDLSNMKKLKEFKTISDDIWILRFSKLSLNYFACATYNKAIHLFKDFT